MENRNIVISLLFLLTAFLCNSSAGQMPAGMEPDFKPTAYQYQDWRIHKGDTVQMGDSSRAVVKALEQYKINGWEKMYLRLQKLDNSIIEGELENLLNSRILLHGFSTDIKLENPHIRADDSLEMELLKNRYYVASNGVKYIVGDSVQLGYGSAEKSKFLFLTLQWLPKHHKYAYMPKPEELQAEQILTKVKLRILSIRARKIFGVYKIFFLVGDPALPYELRIEEAIGKCEVLPCNTTMQSSQQFSAADEILKFKKLMDDGIITKEEFEAKKQQLLSK